MRKLIIFSVLLLIAFIPGVQADDQWCDGNFSARYKFTVTNIGPTNIPSTATATNTVNGLTLNLTNNTIMYYQSGTDCEVVHWYNSTPITATTNISFMLQAAIGVGSSDNNYYMYVDNRSLLPQAYHNHSKIFNFSERWDDKSAGAAYEGGGWGGGPISINYNGFGGSINNSASYPNNNNDRILHPGVVDKTDILFSFDFNLTHGTADTYLQQIYAGMQFNNDSNDRIFGIMLNYTNTTKTLGSVYFLPSVPTGSWASQAGAVDLNLGFANDKWYTLSVIKRGTTIWVRVENSTYQNTSSAITINGSEITKMSIFRFNTGLSASDREVLLTDEIRWIQEANSTLTSSSVEYLTTNIYECDSGQALNISIWNEQNLTGLNASIDIAFNGQNINASFSSTGQEFGYCLGESFVGVYNVTAKYGQNESYPDRWYYGTNINLSNESITNVPLYLLSESLANDISFTVQNVYQTNLPNIIVKVQRYYPGTDSYRIVAMGKTGYDGRTSIPLKLLEYYRFFLVDGGVTLSITDPTQIIDTSKTLYTSTTSAIDFFQFYNQIGYSCSYSDATTVITCSISDSSECLQSATLTANAKRAFNSTVEACSDTDAGSVITLNCNVGIYNTSPIAYQLKGSLKCGTGVSTTYTITTGTIDSGASDVQWGSMGLFASLIFITVFGFAGRNDPRLMVALSYLAVVASNIIGWIPVDWTYIAGLGVPVVVLIYYLNKV